MIKQTKHETKRDKILFAAFTGCEIMMLIGFAKAMADGKVPILGNVNIVRMAVISK